MANHRSRWPWLILIALLAVAGVFIYRWDRTRAVQAVAMGRVERQDIRSGVVTNGKAEPIEFREVHAEVEGQVTEVPVRDGDELRQGQKLLGIAQKQIASDIEHARAQLADAQEALRLLKQGGSALDLKQLQTQIDLAKRERDVAAGLVAQNERLVEKGAVAKFELEQSRDRLAKAEADLAMLQQKQSHRYDPQELARTEAAVGASRAALDFAEARERSLTAVSPLAGRAYSLAVRVGDFVHAGDLLMRVGDFRQVRVRVYVDEPDLGKVTKGQSVMVTWDGLPGRQWRGTVDRLPSEIKELGTRKVGEVSCILDNPKLELLPNMNLNVEIIVEERPSVLTIPREALFGAESGRYALLVREGILVRQPVQTGIVNVTRVEVRQGLKEGDTVAIGSDTPLREGLQVRDSAG